MADNDRRFRNAIRITPKDERPRYAEEWTHDLQEATVADNASDVARGALGVALRRRARWAGHALLGGRGIGLAVLLWLGIIGLMIIAFLGGGLFELSLLVILVLALVALTFAGLPSRLTYVFLFAFPIIGLAAAAYCWWVLGVQIDAADTGASVPPAATHGGLGLIVLAASGLGFVVAAVIGYARRPN